MHRKTHRFDRKRIMRKRLDPVFGSRAMRRINRSTTNDSLSEITLSVLFCLLSMMARLRRCSAVHLVLCPVLGVEVVCAHSGIMDLAVIRVVLAALAVVVPVVVIAGLHTCLMAIGIVESGCRMVGAGEVEAVVEAGGRIKMKV